ncbi:MAG: hypothetical protein V5B38_02535 [Candidatus Accumulibacter propinquus]|jgi:hypothetical protein
MKRQITGFAIESGFSGPGRSVPAYLVPDVQELTDEVCAAVDALVESYRPSMLWWEQPFAVSEEQGVAWYENQADRLSMQLLKKIFADETLDLKMQLSLAQLVEEIDRVADQAEGIDKELRASRTAACPLPVQEIRTDSSQPAPSRSSSCPAAFGQDRFPLCSAGTRHHVAGFPPAAEKPIVLRSHAAQAV